MKTRINRINRIGIALSSAFILSQSAPALTTANGDLLIGFYQIIGGSVQSKTYVFDLGKASLYRENTQSNVAVSVVNPAISANIGADLATIFGEDWAESGTVYWSIFGAADQNTVGVLDGDNIRTPYISLPVSSFVVGDSTTQPTVNSAGRSSVSNSVEAIRTFADSTQLGTPPIVNPVGPVYLSGYNPSGNQVPASGSLGKAVDSFFPPNSIPTGSQLSLGTELRGLFDTDTMAGSAEHEGALDVYRYLSSFTVSGVDLSTGFGGTMPAVNTAATLGVGQYIGTFTIDASGIIKIYGAPPIAPSGYSTWATTNGVTGQAANLDHDNDGVLNGAEYFIGGPTGNTTGFTALPGVTVGGGGSSVTWTKASSYTGTYATDFVVETSTTLAVDSWTNAALGAVNVPGTVNISGDNVKFTFPAGSANTFARLKVTGP
jgi:hypothetical protein